MKQQELEDALVYLDINNLFHRYKKLNFIKLREYLKNKWDILRITAYNSIDTTNQNQKAFSTFLSNNGYRCKTLDVKVNSNIDGLINVDIVTDSHHLKPGWVILISGDGDYSYVLDQVSRSGIKTCVIGVRENTSLELLKIADKVIYLEDLDVILEYNNN